MSETKDTYKYFDRRMVLEEYLRRQADRSRIVGGGWETPDFPHQNAFINDSSPLILARCSRRSGKSYGAVLRLLKDAYETPKCSVLYLGLTRASVKRIVVKDCLIPIDQQRGLNLKPNAQDLSYTLPNGSVLYLLGIDSSENEKAKVLGQKFKTIVIDEAAFYRHTDLRQLVFEYLKPAVSDYNGHIIIISTTSPKVHNLFYDVDTGKDRGWSIHRWTAFDNPFMAKKIQKEITELRISYPEIEKTPSFRRMYLNEWVIEDGLLVYKYTTGNLIAELPKLSDGGWNYVLGVDFGYRDDTSFVVLAYHDNHPKLYGIAAFKKPNLIVDQVANEINHLRSVYDFTAIVSDHSKQIVETLRRKYGIPLINATKTDKHDFIEILNSDLKIKNFSLLSDTQDLLTEWDSLVWDEKKKFVNIYKEDPSCPNHCADACLYAWRFCRQYAFEPTMVREDPRAEAAVDKFWEQEEEELFTNNPDNWLEG